MTDTDASPAKSAEKTLLSTVGSDANMTSPVDLPPMEGEDGGGLLWTSTVIAIATAILLLFNADALRGWAYDLEPGPESERVIAISDGWYRQTERFDLDRPVAVMSGWWEDIKALEFGSGAEEAISDDAPTQDRPAPRNSDSPGFSPG